MYQSGVSISWRVTFSVLAITFFSLGTALAQTPALLLFGESDHKTFLGCLNCSKYDNGSVCNEYGQNGSKYNSESIWNPYGNFGSKYSSNSPWNQYGSSGPVIVDNSGRFYGRFTANKYASARTRIQQQNQLTDAVSDVADLDVARKLLCGE